MSQNPFPGPQPYRAADRPRFHGRDDMARKLAGSILAHRCVTVFGPSGAGKSSLMQAAVIPRLMEEHAFRAVRVDSWPEGVVAATWLGDAMFNGFKLGARPEETAPADMVVAAAQRAARRSERPFLIYLDQIEELLFHNRDPGDLDGFAECIHALAELPIRGLKLVLSLREDYLGRLRDRLQGRLRLLDHGFRVVPLRVGELSEAMCKVAATGEPPQTWSLEETRALMMQVRTPGQAATDEAEAQAAYAQIVCRALFGQRDAAGGGAPLSGAFNAEEILKQYLEATIAGLGELGEDARRLLEDHLITADGSRTLRTEKELRGELSQEALETVLRTLEGAAILRAEEHQGRRYFELGHDWLAKQVLERIRERQRTAVEEAREEMRAAEDRMREAMRAAEDRAREMRRAAEDRVREAQLQRERRRLRGITIAAVAVAVGALIIAFPVIRSYMNNRTFIRQTTEKIEAVESINWNDSGSVVTKLDKLQSLLDQLETIADYKRNGPPGELGWGMYKGDDIERPAITAYVTLLQKVCVVPVKQRLEDRLALLKGDKYLEERDLLRTYLMLDDIDHLDVDEERYLSKEKDRGELTALDGRGVRAITALWAELLRPISDASDEALLRKLRPHVRHYLRLLKSRRVSPLPRNPAVVDAARKTLQKVSTGKHYFDVFVSSLIDEKIDEWGPNTPENLRYPPIVLSDMFADRPEALKVLTSALFRAEKRWKGVEGPYTELGHYRVLKNIAGGAALLDREEWVVPRSAAESDDIVAANLRTLAEDYERRYVEQWTEWMSDIEVRSPATVEEAIALYAVLLRPPYPYLAILRALQDHTEWPRSASALETEERMRGSRDAQTAIQDRVEARREAATGMGVLIDLRSINGRESIVPSTFRSTVQFGVPHGSDSILDAPLAKYISILEALRNELMKLRDARDDGPVDPRLVSGRLDEARRLTEALLKPFDERAKTLLLPLLTRPLRIGAPR